jgi:hypothetical protein
MTGEAVFVFVFSDGVMRAHTHIVDPSEVEATIERLTEEGHTNFRLGTSEEDAVSYEEWLRCNRAPE